MSAEFNNIAQVDKNAASKASDQAVELGKGFGTILEKALVEPDGRDAVAQARQALADGSLDNEQAIESAADNLMNFGI